MNLREETEKIKAEGYIEANVLLLIFPTTSATASTGK